jgi:ATP-binding protein involved in chromosome partitioning
VGKSSVTVNLAAALAAAGQRIGLLDADVYGHSVPRMLGIDTSPTRVENMIMPLERHGVRAISAGMMKHGNEPIPVRGPILHKLLEHFLVDVWWGDLDILLLDLPPGTGDVAISVAQLIPGSQLIVVTTPQVAAAEVAERAGSLAVRLHQRVVGVIENMSYLPCPHCGERVEVFGTGGGESVASVLTRVVGSGVPVLGQVPIDLRLREAGDSGIPVVLSDPGSPAARQLAKIAHALAMQSREPEGQPRSVA